MGSNKRYAAFYDGQMDKRILEQTMAGSPDSLTSEEQELDVYPLTKPPKPTLVTVWVRYGPVPLKVEANAVAWTTKAVAVQWTTPAGETHRAWVWSSAVE